MRTATAVSAYTRTKSPRAVRATCQWACTVAAASGSCRARRRAWGRRMGRLDGGLRSRVRRRRVQLLKHCVAPARAERRAAPSDGDRFGRLVQLPLEPLIEDLRTVFVWSRDDADLRRSGREALHEILENCLRSGKPPQVGPRCVSLAESKWFVSLKAETAPRKARARLPSIRCCSLALGYLAQRGAGAVRCFDSSFYLDGASNSAWHSS